MPVRGLNHVNFRAPANTIERLRRFYVDVVGLHEGSRPRFHSGSQGCWLYAGSVGVVHLTIADDDTGGAHQGCFNHVAFNCDDLAAAQARLNSAGIAYTTDVIDELHQVQLFLVDPVGVGVELDFIDPRDAGC
ncbi:MAG TPA: VOC family protein [Rhodanobacteraceae bacterium]|nr:VOC family protein [Rhodanobacteraceae bacterium]